jgi:hypothetical protein
VKNAIPTAVKKIPKAIPKYNMTFRLLVSFSKVDEKNTRKIGMKPGFYETLFSFDQPLFWLD